jgi:hypothetical protein
VLFLNPKLSGSDSDEEEISLGLGFRALCPKVDAIAGLNVFYDSRRTAHDNTFDQIGAGVEVLSAWVDARANYYWPDDKQEMIDRQSDTEVDRYVDHSYSDLYAEGHQILQLEKIKTTTITTTRFFERFEAALEGYDLELGFRLPYLPDWLETRVFAGYYAFEGDFTEDIDGVKGRLEIRALPILTLDAEIYEDDALAGSDYFVGARVNVPFDLANLAQGKNPFAGTSEQVKAARRTFRDRLNEMVIRDPHVRLHESGFIENEGLKQVDTDIDRDENELVILDDVNFVNNKNTGFENGTDEHPYNTVQEGVDNVFGDKNVYVYKGIKSYRENVRIEEDGVSLLGEGCAIEGFGGEKFGGGKFPVLNGNVGGVNGPVVRVNSDNVLIKGFEITRSAGGANPGNLDALGFAQPIDLVGILGENADNLVIACNRINNQSVGILGLYDPTEPGAPQDYHIRITDNTIADSPVGVQLLSTGAGAGRFTARVDNNVFDNGAIFGVQATLSGLSDVDLAITGNTFRNPSAFLAATAVNITNDASIRIADNVFKQGGQLIAVGNLIGRDLDLEISGNRLLAGAAPSLMQTILGGAVGRDLWLHIDKNYVENGLAILPLAPVTRNADISFSGNVFLDSPGGALTMIGSTVGGNAVLRFDNNRIVDAVGAGITAILPPLVGNDLYVSASGNRITDALGGGLTLAGAGLMNNAYVSMHNNRILNSAGGGLTATFGSITGNAVVATSGNRVNDNSGNGMTLLLGAVSGNADISVLNSEFNDNGGPGLTLMAPSVGGTLNVVIDPTTANNNIGVGMSLTLNSIGDLSLLMEDVTASRNTGVGIAVSANSISGSVQAAFVNVRANANTMSGMSATLLGQKGVALVHEWPLILGEGESRIQANGNGGPGLVLTAISESGSVIAVTERIEVSGNTGIGASMTLDGPEGATAFLGDVIANTNNGIGISITGVATNGLGMFGMSSLQARNNALTGASLTFAALDSVQTFIGTDIFPFPGLPPSGIIDVSGNNGGPGLSLTATSVGGGATVVLGDIIANDNFGPGVSVTVSGPGNVTAVLGLGDGTSFPDLQLGTVQANGNGGPGLLVTAISDEEMATVAIGSGEASGNTGGGAFITAVGGDDVAVGLGVLVLGGTPLPLYGTFSANTNIGGGAYVYAQSTNGSVTAIHFGGQVDGNQGTGLDYDLYAFDSATLLLGGSLLGIATPPLSVSGNLDGLAVDLASQTDSATLIAGGLELNNNTLYGLNATLSAVDDAQAIMGYGVVDGQPTIQPVRAVSNNMAGINITAVSQSNEVDVLLLGFEANDNLLDGVSISGFAEDRVAIGLGDVPEVILPLPLAASGVANGSQIGAGVRVTAVSDSNSVLLALGNLELRENAMGGAVVTADAPNGSITSRVVNVTAISNGLEGVSQALTALNTVELLGEDNQMRGNLLGLVVDADGAVLNLDFGGGALGSAGNNSFSGNTVIGVTNAGSGTVSAQQNWWGAPVPVLGVDFGVNVDASSPLAADPNP